MGNIATAEPSRMLVTVSKKTISKTSDKSSSGSDRNRRQTLAVSVTNQSVQSLPAGVIRWTAVVRKPYSELLKYSGKSDLPALPSFKMAEVQCGAFNVKTRQSDSGTENDRVEYEIAILHDGKETYHTTSVSNFAVLAEKAEEMHDEDGAAGNGENNRNDQDDNKSRKRREMRPEEPAIIGAEKMPAQKPETPVAEIAPAAPATMTAPPVVPHKAFDFFNLRGKSSPSAK
jgi:hypothetical protein